MNILADLRLRSGENQLTQKAFEGALPAVKSAVMDSKGRVWLFECTKSHLTANHRSWVSDIETGFTTTAVVLMLPTGRTVRLIGR